MDRLIYMILGAGMGLMISPLAAFVGAVVGILSKDLCGVQTAAELLPTNSDMELDEDEEWFLTNPTSPLLDDSSMSISNGSLDNDNFGLEINPANGLPMVDQAIDVAGNPYGMDN